MLLKGMTWSHDRGLKPLLAASKKFSELHEGVKIEWDARSLSDFELFPIEQLANRYDFIMIDHPHIGTAYVKKLLKPLDTLLPEDFLREQEESSVGQSHNSYFYEGHQWALAADAAAQVSVWRPDLLSNVVEYEPERWDDVIRLASSLKLNQWIAMPFVPIHAFSTFYTLASQISKQQVWKMGRPLDINVGVMVLELLSGVLKVCHPDSFHMNPIQLLDRMAQGDDLVYCPLSYGYSTYSTRNYRNHSLKFGDIPSDTGAPEGSMIGGVGLAISSGCKHSDIAAEFVKFVVEPSFQQGTFARNHGQPGHRSAWLSDQVNDRCMNFYKDTLDTLDWGSMRPRYNGYVEFQAKAGTMIRDYFMTDEQDAEMLIEAINEHYIAGFNQR